MKSLFVAVTGMLLTSGLFAASTTTCTNARGAKVFTVVRGSTVKVTDHLAGLTEEISLKDWNSSSEYQLYPGGLNDWEIWIGKDGRNDFYRVTVDDCRSSSYQYLDCSEVK